MRQAVWKVIRVTTETVTLITVVAGFAFKALQDHLTWKRSEWSAHERRKWDVQDRQQLRQELEKNMEQKHSVIVKKLEENTALTAFAADAAVAATNEAADFKRKWESIEILFSRVNGRGHTP